MGVGIVAGGRELAELEREEGEREWGDGGVERGGLGRETPPLTKRVLNHCHCSWCLLQHAPEGKGEERHVREVEREVRAVRGEVVRGVLQRVRNGLSLAVAGW